MSEHYVRPDEPDGNEPASRSTWSRLRFRLAHLLDDRQPGRYEDGRLPMIGFGGGVRQMFDRRVRRPGDPPADD